LNKYIFQVFSRKFLFFQQKTTCLQLKIGMNEYIIRIKCPDEKGLVHKITGVLYKYNLNVNRTDEYVDPSSETFFMRAAYSGNAEVADILNELKAVLPENNEVNLLP
jgi:formyltetrahydrofolate deformylase